MKKLFLFLFAGYVLLSTQAYSQNWLQVGEYVSLSTFNEITEFDDTLYAVGHIWNGVSGGSSRNTPTVWKLVDNTWTQVGSGFAEGYYISMNAIVEYDSELYVGGSFTCDNGTDPAFNYVAKWDDVSGMWVAVGDGTGSGGGVYELTVFNDTLYAGGDFGELGTAGTNNIAEWGGNAWGPVGAGLSVGTSGDPDQVASMVVYNDTLYVGGKFDDAGGKLVHNIAKWSGTEWDWLEGNDVDFGGGVDYLGDNVVVLAMAVFDDKLHIGGNITRIYTTSLANTSMSNNLVTWDGFSLSTPVVSTPSNTRINAMTVFNDRFYIGNYFDDEIYSFGAGDFMWNLEPSLGTSYKVTSFYSNVTDIYFAFNSGIYRFADPLPKFTASTTVPCSGEDVTFTDQSEGSNDITAWNWTFEGGTPATSAEQNPVVTYAANGIYDVSLEVTSSDGSNTQLSTDYIEVNDTIEITVQPVDATICSGVQATFTTAAIATGEKTYQWQVDSSGVFEDLKDTSSIVVGATTTSLKFMPKAHEDGIKFRCIIFNCTNSDTTDEATLTVTAAPEWQEYPTAVALCVEGDTSFMAVAETYDGATVSYQWKYRVPDSPTYSNLTDDAVYGGTTTNKLTITGADNTLAELYDYNNSDGKVYAIYQLTASANGCDKTSSLIYLNIHDIPTVSVQPEDFGKCDVGTGATGYIFVNSSLAPGGFPYRWQVDTGDGSFVDVVDDTVFTGSDTYKLSFTEAGSMYSGNEYRAIIGNCATDVISNIAILTIDDRPVDTLTSSTLIKICQGSNAIISVSPTHSENTTFQWQDPLHNLDIQPSAPFSGTKTATLVISDAGTDLHLTRYKCIMTNGLCVQNSKQFTLNVYPEPSITSNPPDMTACDSGIAVQIRANVSDVQTGVNGYQWQEDFAGTGIFSDITDTDAFSNINARTLIVEKPVFSLNNTKYRLKLTGCENEIVSGPATLTVKRRPFILTSPQSAGACFNQNLVLSVGVFDAGPDYRYKWYKDDGDGAGYTQVYSSADTVYNAGTMQPAYDGRKYKVIVDNGTPCNAEAESQVATISVPSATLGTQDVVGATVNFTGNTVNAAVDSFYWNFGDGYDTAALNPVHTYLYNGTFSPRLMIYDNCGGSSQLMTVVSITAVGLDEFDALARISIYPNPAGDVLTVDHTSLNDRIEVFDLGGRKILEMKAYSDRTIVDVSGYAKGLYVLKVSNHRSVREFRFAKQ